MVTLTRTTAAQRSMLGHVANAGEMHARMLLDLEASVAALEGGEAAEVSKTMLASVAEGASGASLVGVEDPGDLFEAADVEAALAEVKTVADAAAPAATFFHDVMNLSPAANEGAALITGTVIKAGVPGYAIHLEGFKILVNGAEALAGDLTHVKLEDTADVPVELISAPKAAFTANTVVSDASAGVTAKLAYITGATAEKGLKLVAVGGTPTVTAGSDFRVLVWGRLVPV